MDSKLKTLKVVDLKQILATANQSVPTKANKSDLIARILASSDALAVYNSLYPPVNPPATKEPSPTPDVLVTVVVDPELEKRKQRAARFGIPVVETKDAPVAVIEADKRKTRAARFGLTQASTSAATPSTTAKRSLKRSAQEEILDADEIERRKKRAERFGIPVKS